MFNIQTAISGLSGKQKLLLTTVPAALVAVYLWLRHEQDQQLGLDGDDDRRARRRRERHRKKHEAQLEVRVPTTSLGMIIGREGKNIRQLQENTGTNIRVLEDQQPAVGCSDGGEKESVLLISGSTLSVQHARQQVMHLVSSRPDTFTVNVPVPPQMIGRIIGKGGLRIRDLQRASGAKIVIEKGEGSNAATIKGTVQQIDLAKLLLQEILDEAINFEERLKKAIASRERRGKGEVKVSESEVKVSKDGDIVSKSQQVTPVSGGSGSGDEHNLPIEQLLSSHSDGYIEVLIPAVLSPNNFYLQLANDKLDRLADSMEVMYSAEGYRCEEEDIREGNLVAAKFTDGKWYRARVREIGEGGINVYFIDYGDFLTIPRRDLCKLVDVSEFCELPQQAIECYLHGVVARAGEEWSVEAVKMFDELTYAESFKRLMAKVVHMRGDGKPCVQLVDTNTAVNINVADELVKAGHAQAITTCE